LHAIDKEFGASSGLGFRVYFLDFLQGAQTTTINSIYSFNLAY